MRCIACQRHITKSASPSLVIGPVCLRKSMPRPKRTDKGQGRAQKVMPGQMRLELEDGAAQ
jgi:hypothetical protein